MLSRVAIPRLSASLSRRRRHTGYTRFEVHLGDGVTGVEGEDWSFFLQRTADAKLQERSRIRDSDRKNHAPDQRGLRRCQPDFHPRGVNRYRGISDRQTVQLLGQRSDDKRRDRRRSSNATVINSTTMLTRSKISLPESRPTNWQGRMLRSLDTAVRAALSSKARSTRRSAL